MYIISLVGRQGVGKTNLFYKLLNCKNYYLKNITNIVDFNYCVNFFNKKYFIFIDNISYDLNFIKKFNNEKFYKNLYNKFLLNIKYSDLICFMVDCSIGLLQDDLFIYKSLLKNYNNKILLILNKQDLLKVNINIILCQFNKLNIKNILVLSIFKNFNLNKFLIKICSIINNKNIIKLNNIKYFKILLKNCLNLQFFKLNKLLIKKNELFSRFNIKFFNIIKIIILGKSNVGKSTFLNYIIGSYRSIVSKNENTTKNFLFYNFIFDNINFMISDSPGINKKYFIKQKLLLEFYKKINFFNIVFYVIDIYKSISKYDLSLIKLLLNKGKMVILFFNKCEEISNREKFNLKLFLKKKYGFLKNIFIFFICALNLNNKFILSLFRTIYRRFNNIFKVSLTTSKINKILKLAINNLYYNNNFTNLIKLKYAHIGSYTPLTIVIHGKRIKYISNCHKKYLMNFYIKFLKFSGYSIKIKFKEIINPYILK